MKHVEQAGGTFNGSTTWDRTNYFETLPANRLELALWLESDRMMSLDVSQENLDNQREVVKEERRYRVDNRPYGTAWEKIFSMAYSVHPYKWPVVGYLDHLNAASIDDVRMFFNTFYVPNNAVLSVAGRFQPATAKKLVAKYFSDIPVGPSAGRNSEIEPDLGSHIRDVVYDRVALPAIYMVFRAPSMKSEDSIAMNLGASVLSQGKSSRLYRRLVYDMRIAQSVEAFQVDMEDPGLFVVNAVVSRGHSPEEVEEAIRKELKSIVSKPPSAKELQKVGNQFESYWVKTMSRSMGRADHLAHFRTFFGNTGLINSYPANVLSVTAREISRVADRYLDTEKNVVVYYLPGEAAKTAGSK